MQEVPSASFAVNAAPVEGRLSHAETGGASMALQRSVRALDGVERIGRLLTLDLKSNEIRVSLVVSRFGDALTDSTEWDTSLKS